MGHHPQRERAADLPRFVELAAAEARRPARLRRMGLVPPVALPTAVSYVQLGEAA
jgi:hypothetical protein